MDIFTIQMTPTHSMATTNISHYTVCPWYEQERIEPAREHVSSINSKIQTWRTLIVTTKYGDVPCGHPYVTVSSTTCIGSLETKLTTYMKPLQQACWSQAEDKPWNGLSACRKPGHEVD